MQSIESQQENSAKFNQILAFIKKKSFIPSYVPGPVIHQVNRRPGIRDCDARDWRCRKHGHRHRRLGTRRYPTSSLRRRGVTRRALALYICSMFKFRRRLLREQTRVSTQSRRCCFLQHLASRWRHDAVFRKRLREKVIAESSLTPECKNVHVSEWAMRHVMRVLRSHLRYYIFTKLAIINYCII